ncbi:hypothetical protein LXL04_003273 [Taraxacum kok-saghyz]
MSDTEGTSKPEKLLASLVSPATGKDLSNPVIAMGLLKSHGTQRTPDFYTDKHMEPQRTPLSSTNKNKQNMVEIWDSLGEQESPASSTSKNTQTVPRNNENSNTYEAYSSRKNEKNKKFDKRALQETINETVQEILKTMLPKYDSSLEKIITEDESTKHSPLPSYLSCPNDNVSEEEDESNDS